MMTDKAITDLIPQRPPFLFVDTIGAVESERILTTWCPQPDAPFFAGHYPGNPVLPGVLICESCFQAGAALMAWRGAETPAGGVAVLTRIQDARFKRIVRPGEELVVETQLTQELDSAAYLTSRARVGGQLAARIEYAVMATSDTGVSS
jgi:3-hydroxyacyl-[acyl-carrier-protein] dehydratase